MADLAGETGGADATVDAGTVPCVGVIPTWTARKVAYASGDVGKRERNNVHSALKLWLQNRCSWPSRSEQAATLTALVPWMAYEAGVGTGKRVGGKLLKRWFDDLQWHWQLVPQC